MTKTRSFKSRGLQSVRLPEDVAFSESVTEVTVVREGARVIVSPVGASWDDFFQ
jgi:virulence-associated protein VagC